MKKITVLLIAASLLMAANFLNAQAIDKSAIYAALSGNKLGAVDASLNTLSLSSGYEKEAFEGALLMRKAGFVAIPAKKLSLFKQGHKKLEAAIQANPENVEYRFLRLMIQENAPKALGYHKNIAADSKFIKEKMNNLPPVAKENLQIYARRSAALR